MVYNVGIRLRISHISDTPTQHQLPTSYVGSWLAN